MPYPYSNDLGKKPPPSSPAAIGAKKIASKASPEQLAQLQGLINQKSMEKIAEQQQKIAEAFFKKDPLTIKFPNVLPASVAKDYPGNTPANKFGKPDLTAIEGVGPVTLPLKTEEWLEKWKADLQKGIINKQELYAKLYAANDAIDAAKFKSKVLGEFPDPVLENLKQAYESPKDSGWWVPPKVPSPSPTSYMGFTKQGTGIGEQDSFELKMQFRIEGIEGLDGKTLYAKQLVSKQFIASQYGKSAKEKIIDDMLRQIKLEIMEQIKKGK